MSVCLYALKSHIGYVSYARVYIIHNMLCTTKQFETKENRNAHYGSCHQPAKRAYTSKSKLS